MQWKNIPQEYRFINLRQHLPDDGGRPLGYRWSFGCARKSKTAVNLAERLKMNLVRERKPRSPSSPVTQIARNPHRVYAVFSGCLDNREEIGSPPLRGIGPVMQQAPVAVRIKDIFKMDSSESVDKSCGFHAFIFSKVMVRLVRSAMIVPPRCFRSWRNTS